MIKSSKRNIIIIALMVFYSWGRILGHVFQGEGYYYFFKKYTDDGHLFRYDSGAGLLFDIIQRIFFDNFFLYQGLAVLSFIAISILFYFFILELTNRKDVSFLGALLFGVNYTSSFEMLALGAYQNFVQRVFFLLLVFPSFIFFFKFIKSKNPLHYFFSLFLSMLSAFFAHFSIFYIVFFIAFACINLIYHRSKYKEAVLQSFLAFTIFLLSLLIVYIPLFLGTASFLEGKGLVAYLLSNPTGIIFHSFRQLTILTIPENILLLLGGTSPPLHQQGMEFLFLPVLIIYFIVFLLLYRKEKGLRVQIVTVLLFMPIVFVLNMYMRGDNVDHLGSGSRYLFAPSLGFAIFWAIFFCLIVKKYNKNFGYTVLIIWFLLQIIPINRELNKQEIYQSQTKEILKYVKKMSPKFSEDSIVFLPNEIGNWGANFCNLFYGKRKTVFLLTYPQIEWKEDLKRNFDPKKDFILDYDFVEKKVIDKTNNYKKTIVYPVSKMK